MNPLTQSKCTITLPILIAFVLACFAFSPTAQAVNPAGDGAYPNNNTAEADDALFSLTTGADNTAMGFAALARNPINADNALASWIWKAAGSLNTARAAHTATLLQNGMVLVAGGLDRTFIGSASAELYDPVSLRTATGVSIPREVTATLLAWSCCGGYHNVTVSATAELYNPQRNLDCHRQPPHRTRWSHGDVVTKRHDPCRRGN